MPSIKDIKGQLEELLYQAELDLDSCVDNVNEAKDVINKIEDALITLPIDKELAIEVLADYGID